MTEVLMNHYDPFDLIPNEIVSNILILNDPDTLFVCRLVCKRWQQLIDTYVFQEKAARENEFANNGRGYYSFSHIHPNDVRSLEFPWYVFYTICKHDPFNRNLVKNPCGHAENECEHWDTPESVNVINSMLPAWSLFYRLLSPKPPDELTNDIAANDPDHIEVNMLYSPSFPYFNSMYQKIIFNDYGLNHNVMKSLLPEISFSAWVINGCYRHYKYILQAIIHNRSENIIAEHNVCPPEIRHKWIKISSSFKVTGNESSLTLHHKIDDRHKVICDIRMNPDSLKITCSVVKVLLPIKFKLKLPEPKISIFN